MTDENEEAADPLAIAGQGWAFDNQNFPGSPNGASPEGTIECRQFDPNNPPTTGPNSPNCTSCAFIAATRTSRARCPKDGANGANGYLDPNDDTLNTRFFHQKQRFGALRRVPDVPLRPRHAEGDACPTRAHEHDGNGNYVGDQDANANCVNPIYAQNLPTDPTRHGRLCNLTRGHADAGPRLLRGHRGRAPRAAPVASPATGRARRARRRRTARRRPR